MGPLTKRRHSTHRSGRRQAGQKKLGLVTKPVLGYVSKKKREELKKGVVKAK